MFNTVELLPLPLRERAVTVIGLVGHVSIPDGADIGRLPGRGESGRDRYGNLSHGGDWTEAAVLRSEQRGHRRDLAVRPRRGGVSGSGLAAAHRDGPDGPDLVLRVHRVRPGTLEVPGLTGTRSLPAAAGYGLAFFGIAVLLSTEWSAVSRQEPLEWVMRKTTATVSPRLENLPDLCLK